jgi:hypothetical protein
MIRDAFAPPGAPPAPERVCNPPIAPIEQWTGLSEAGRAINTDMRQVAITAMLARNGTTSVIGQVELRPVLGKTLTEYERGVLAMLEYDPAAGGKIPGSDWLCEPGTTMGGPAGQGSFFGLIDAARVDAEATGPGYDPMTAPFRYEAPLAPGRVRRRPRRTGDVAGPVRRARTLVGRHGRCPPVPPGGAGDVDPESS